MRSITLVSLLVLASCNLPEPVETSKRPNLVLIMADDMGYSDIGCYGSEIPTPHLDSLAGEGLRFTQFYNASRCCPTRASLLTGLYPHRAGMGDMVNSNATSPAYQGFLNRNCLTLAEVLKSAGYRTLMSGKWHVGEDRPHWPTDRGFERYFGLISGASNYFDPSKAKEEGIRRRLALDDQPYTPPNEGFYMTSAITEHALGFLEAQRDHIDPFFIYVAYTAPHWPLHALPEDIEQFIGDYREGWDALRERRYSRMVDLGLLESQWHLSPRDSEVPAWSEVDDHEEMDRRMAVYAAQIYRMDLGVGQILDKLKAINREENTLVLFLSDNGACHEGGPLGFDNRQNGLPAGGVDSFMSYGRGWSNASNTPFRMHKHWTHEGGISTPLIARWPSVIRNTGALTDQAGHIVDIMATFVEVSGAAYPGSLNGQPIHPMDGRSLLPVFQGRQRQPHEYLFWEHEGSRAVRQGQWKLVAEAGAEWQLYDLEADRTELHNLADAQPERAAQLSRKWSEWADQVGVQVQ